MHCERTSLSFWMAIVGILATLVFAWHATAASSGATGAGRTFVGWIPKAYAIEAVAISALIAIVLHPARVHKRWSIDAAWIGCGALTTIALMSAMTVGGTLAPGAAIASAAAWSGTRQGRRGAGRAIAAGIVGAVAQVALMLLVIGAAMMLSPRSS
jgi:hypothetical protein